MDKKPVKLIIVTAVILAVAGINSVLVPKLNDMRHNEGITRNMPLDNAPPQYVVAVNLLGGLRCVLIDMLWLRTIKLREEGKFFEMAQLYKWICELEPQIEDIWTHNAWNMAYNISYEMPFAQDRWRWVLRAIELLRDQGLKYNSRSAVIRREIAWIFLHKIGQQWDDMHQFYKKQWAIEMNKLIKSPEEIKVLAQCPDLKTVLNNNPRVKSFWDKIKGKEIKSYADFTAKISDPGFTAQNLDGLDEQDIDSLDRVLRKTELEEKYKLDLAVISSLMDQFGPMDLRLPDAHAIYWAYQGKKYAGEKYSIYYDRIIYIAMQSVFRRGKLVLIEQDNDTIFITEPDKRFVKPMNKLYEQLFAKYKDSPEHTKNIRASYYYFLKEAVVLMYTFNEPDQSRKYFEILAKNYPEKIKSATYLSFVLSEFTGTVKFGNYDQIKALVFNLIRQSYWNLALGNDDEYTGYLNLAKIMITEYEKSIGNQDRLKLPPLNVIRQTILNDALEKDFPQQLRESLRKKIETGRN